MPGVAETRALSRDALEAADGRIVIGGQKRATMNVGASLSPDGKRIAYLSEQELLSVDLYLADATTGRTIRKLISTAVDPHFQSLQFLMSAGAWNPNGRELAVAAVRQSHPVLAIVDTEAGKISREIPFETLDEIFQPAWSPDGTRIVFAGQAGGFTDLYVHTSRRARQIASTNDAFADLQPAWSPDSASNRVRHRPVQHERGDADYGRYGLATITPGSPEPRALSLGLTGNATNPQWLPDGSAILFMSIRRAGRRCTPSTARPVAYRGSRARRPASPASHLSVPRCRWRQNRRESRTACSGIAASTFTSRIWRT
jgi:Tol biopolymer transport system component